MWLPGFEGFIQWEGLKVSVSILSNRKVYICNPRCSQRKPTPWFVKSPLFWKKSQARCLENSMPARLQQESQKRWGSWSLSDFFCTDLVIFGRYLWDVRVGNCNQGRECIRHQEIWRKWNWREKKEQVVWWCVMYRPKCQFRTINDINGCVPCPHGLCDSLGNRILRTWTVATRCSLTAKHFDNLTWLSWQVLRCRMPSSSDLVFIYTYLCTHVIDYCT